MTVFTKAVDKRLRGSMAGYLKNHFRYPMLNSWNQATSYAHNLKIHNLGLEKNITDKLFDLIQTEDFHEAINDLLHEFGQEHDFEWQAGFNGRNGGYLVLYPGERRPSGYKSYCPKCGQKNYTSVAETGNVCGRCRKHSRINFSQTHMSIHTFPDHSVDHGEEFADWDIDSLRGRITLVQSFDALADAIVAEAVYMAENYEVCEETVYVPETRKVMTAV